MHDPSAAITATLTASRVGLLAMLSQWLVSPQLLLIKAYFQAKRHEIRMLSKEGN